MQTASERPTISAIVAADHANLPGAAAGRDAAQT
jgi:hypothetical protein